jgi:hypothetical protein
MLLQPYRRNVPSAKDHVRKSNIRYLFHDTSLWYPTPDLWPAALPTPTAWVPVNSRYKRSAFHTVKSLALLLLQALGYALSLVSTLVALPQISEEPTC